MPDVAVEVRGPASPPGSSATTEPPSPNALTDKQPKQSVWSRRPPGDGRGDAPPAAHRGSPHGGVLTEAPRGLRRSRRASSPVPGPPGDETHPDREAGRDVEHAIRRDENNDDIGSRPAQPGRETETGPSPGMRIVEKHDADVSAASARRASATVAAVPAYAGRGSRYERGGGRRNASWSSTTRDAGVRRPRLHPPMMSAAGRFGQGAPPAR